VLYVSDEWTPTRVVYDMYPASYTIRVRHLPGSWIETTYEGYARHLHGPCTSVVGLSVFLGCQRRVRENRTSYSPYASTPDLRAEEII